MTLRVKITSLAQTVLVMGALIYTTVKDNADERTVTAMDELKPCPFCGGEEIVIRPVHGYFPKSAHRTYYYIQCRNCFARSGDLWRKSKAIEAWNRRAGEEAQDD